MRVKPQNRDWVGDDGYGMWYDPQTVLRTKYVNKYRVCQTSRKLHKVRMSDCSNCSRTLSLPWEKCLVSKSLLRTGTDSTQRWIQVHELDLLLAF